jgi:SAM-dependent methyltransferase
MTPYPAVTRGRTERRAAHASAFDRIGERYDVAFPYKEGQIEAGDWLVARLPTGSRVLDVGCGTGTPTARRLVDAGMRVTGIDISPGMLAIAERDVPEAEFRLLDVLEAGDGLGEFAGIVAFFSLLMLPRHDIPPALRTLRGLLRPGGRLALGMVEADLDDAPIHFLGSSVRVSGYVRDEPRALVEAAGFEVLDLRHLSYAPASTELPPEVQLFGYCRVADPR